VPPCSFFIPKLEVPPSSTMFFLRHFLETLLQPSFYFPVLFASPP
jgi:hypothetical protein